MAGVYRTTICHQKVGRKMSSWQKTFKTFHHQPPPFPCCRWHTQLVPGVILSNCKPDPPLNMWTDLVVNRLKSCEYILSKDTQNHKKRYWYTDFN